TAAVRDRLKERLAKNYDNALRLARHFADLRVSFDTGGMVATALNYGVSSPIDIQIEGGTLQQGEKLAQAIRERVSAVRGTADVRLLQRLDAPYRIVEINRQKATEYGLSAREVIQQVSAALNSSVAIDRNFWIDLETGNQYFVAVQYPEGTERTLQEIL